MKKHLLLLAALSIAIVSCKTNSNMIKNGTQKGWTSLFDGHTTNGWHSYGKTTAGNAWQASNGTLHLDPSKEGRGDLVSNKIYTNFHLKLDWKISPKGNSGIIFLINEDPAQYGQTYSTGPEMQVLDNDGHPDGKILKHRAGDLYDLIKSSSEPVKPVGQWNTAEIICNKGQLEFKLNGKKIVSTTLWDNHWKALITGSKFANWPGFGTFHSGKIALQDHGNNVWYRNIKIKEL